MRTHAGDTVDDGGWRGVLRESKYAKLAGKALPDARACRVQDLLYGVNMLGDVGVLATELASAGT
jgi:hypothetical protein